MDAVASPKRTLTMLPATQDEIDHVIDYMRSQAPDLEVTFVQKVYSENVLHVRHDVWDVHTNVDRWWVITQPMNLYSQEQFPNMDLAVTFHIGLCLRIPRSERQRLSELPVEPFAEAYRYVEEAQEALQHSSEVADYQAIGVRCREALLAFIAAAQTAIPWMSTDEAPKKADLKAWADHICNTSLPRADNEHRRHLYKTLLDSTWKFVNWLTHAKSSHWHDAEAGIAATENTIALCTSAVIRHIRGVPERCPTCGSQRLSRERGIRIDLPDVEWERPVCDKCGWAGAPVPVNNLGSLPEPLKTSPEGACITPTVPLRRLERPSDEH
jgi:predicted RNA-binding Zn-ribbon protein involved in translation (DUF1610 family)